VLWLLISLELVLERECKNSLFLFYKSTLNKVKGVVYSPASDTIEENNIIAKEKSSIVIRIVPLEKSNANCIVTWNMGKDANFLTQWAGRGYRYPITEEQITKRLITSAGTDFKIYGIMMDESLLGTIELMEIDLNTKRACIGRLLLDPAKTGKGYGTKALRLFVENVFDNIPITTLELTVFDFNKAAIRCYEKTGFVKTTEVIRPNGWIAINMEIARIA
jgi:RimJ/RimL family protein N-acetyltransferase